MKAANNVDGRDELDGRQRLRRPRGGNTGGGMITARCDCTKLCHVELRRFIWIIEYAGRWMQILE